MISKNTTSLIPPSFVKNEPKKKGVDIMSSESKALAIEDSMDLLLTLLYVPDKQGKPGEPIEGITRLQKLMFLLQQGVGPKTLVKQAKQYLYKPDKMGPYCGSLSQDLDELQSVGLIETERLRYFLPDDSDDLDDTDETDTKRVESYKYRLAGQGMVVGEKLWQSLSSRERGDLLKFKRFFNALSLRQLLIFVYEKYPKYASKSTIKAQLGLE